MREQREQIEQWLKQSLDSLRDAGVLKTVITPRVVPAKGDEHGDWASNVALRLAKDAGMSPLELARRIVDDLPPDDAVSRVEVAPPGYINFHIGQDMASRVLSGYPDTVTEPAAPGAPRPRVLLEFVSANPTGPLHVGHGRGAAYGASLASLLTRQGYDVECEYYVNDAGRQMDVLTLSVWLRYLALGDGACAKLGEDESFPDGAYNGDYVWDVAAEVRSRHGDALERDLGEGVFAERPGGDGGGGKDAREERLTQLIAGAKGLLGEEYQAIHHIALDMLSHGIRKELEGFRIRYDRWFSEASLASRLDETIARLEKADCLYTQDGALWFRATQYGDEKDRVVRRRDGVPTYFARDAAYHADKYRRGYDRMINIWGADHHGYVSRLRAVLTALGLDAGKLEIILVQFVNLWRDGERTSMSTRAGRFVSLRELCREVGVDAARFFYVTRKPGQHVDFDLDLAKSRNNENPVYYIQYAHARVCSVFRQLESERGIFEVGAADLSRLDGKEETSLMRTLARYNDAVKIAADRMEPHHLIQFLRELAGAFHAYYNSTRFLIDDDDLRNARLLLISVIRDRIADGLRMLGVSSPQKM